MEYVHWHTAVLQLKCYILFTGNTIFKEFYVLLYQGFSFWV